MARRRRRATDRDDSATAFPTEGDVIGVGTPDETTQEDRPRRFEAAREWPDDDRRDEIARRAFQRYQERGGEHGHDQEDWYEAERDVGRHHQ